MYFQYYGVPKTWLDKYLKKAVSHYPLICNMVNTLKHSSNLNSGTFTIFMDHSEGY